MPPKWGRENHQAPSFSLPHTPSLSFPSSLLPGLPQALLRQRTYDAVAPTTKSQGTTPRQEHDVPAWHLVFLSTG